MTLHCWARLQEGSTVLDDMEVEALKEVGESTGLLGVGAAVTEVGLFFG